MAINKTVQAVFDSAIQHIDAQNDTTGSTQTTDTQAYRVRTLNILNGMLDEAYRASSNYEVGADGEIPALDDLTSFDDVIDMDAAIVRGVLPFGLAAKLLANEYEAHASYFQQLYEENLAKCMRRKQSVIEEISDDDGGFVYGGIEYGQFSHW